MLEPSHLIVLGLVIALSGVIWQSLRAPSADPVIASLRTELENTKRELVAARVSPAPVSGVKRFTTYDIEQRLRAIDEIYDFLGSTLMGVSAAGERLAQGSTLFDKIKNGTAIAELDQHADNAKSVIDEYYKLTAKYMYFPDIYNVASSTTDGTPLDVATSSSNLRAELQEMEQRGQIEHAQDYLRNNKLLADWRAAMSKFWPWINKKQQALTEKRRQYEHADVHPR